MDNFQLSWSSEEDFEENIESVWKDLELENDFYDVTLACADNLVKAHKVIISSGSPVLKNILKQNLNQNPVIYLKGVKHSDLKNLITFIYQGKVTVPQEDLDSFLATAKDLKIKGLCKKSTIQFDQGNAQFNNSSLNCMQENDFSKNEDEDSIIAREIEETLNGNINNQIVLGKFPAIVDDLQMKVMWEIDEETTDQLNVEKLVPTKDDHIKEYVRIEENEGIMCDSKEMINIQNKNISEEDNNFSNIATTFGQSNFENLVNINEQDQDCTETDKNKMMNFHSNISDKDVYDTSNLISKNRNILNEDQNGKYKWQYDKGTNVLQCNICDKKYIEKIAFKKHASKVHNIFLHLCELCDYQAPTKLDLDKHENLSHEQIFFPCDQCDYKPSTKYKLKEHIKTIHERIKRFSCGQCDYKSSLNGNLKKHIKSIHNHIRYSCDQCDFSAPQKQRLVVHIRYQCKG